MALNDQPWEERISGDPWKNVIMLECQKVKDKKLESRRPDVSPPPPGGLTETELQHIALGYEAVKSSDQFAQSYLVWQTGRLFVVGPTKEAVQRVKDLGPKHLHIVLLNWRESHHDGMQELLSRTSDGSQAWNSVTIWTSYWIWEETLRDLGQAHEELRNLRFFDFSSNKVKVPTRIEGDGIGDLESQFFDRGSTKLRTKWAGAMFERSVVWDLTCGVSLAMSYSVASQPYLRAEFRCNNHQIAIDPALDWLWSEEADKGVEVEVKPAILAQFQSLYLKIASDSKRMEPEVYRDEALSRHLELLERYVDVERNPTSSFAGGWSLAKTEGEGFEQPVDLTKGKVRFKPLAARDIAITAGEDIPCADIRARTAVVILCGGLMNKAERELIDPGYGLDIAVEGKTERMSILEWRLHQLNRWVQQVEDLESLPILLLTTPETENIVDGCRKKYEKRYKLFNDNDRLKIKRVAAQLIPWIQNPGEPTQWFETDDGGWELSPRGHMDGLRILPQGNRWTSQGVTEWLKGKAFAFIFAFNNLGDVINDDTCSNLGKLKESSATIAVEVFEYKPSADDRDSRWPQLSYCNDPDQLILCKSSYASEAPQASGAFYSSLTWHVKLKKSVGPEYFESKASSRGFVLRRSASERPNVFGQDIDMITHSSEITILALPSFSTGDQPPASLYAYPRYLGVRTKDHIGSKVFGKAFAEVGRLDGPFPTRAQLINQEKRPPLLISWPKHQEYVWGGHEIATLKGLPGIYREMRLAETWEVSTHERDQSQVMLNTNNKVSLLEILDGQHLDYMAKYLDCHGALSLQVHPTRKTGEFLWDKDFQVRDKAGKAESFFVLKKAPGNRAHLFLGFDRKALRPLAKKIRPRLKRASESEQLTEQELVEIWSDLCGVVKRLCLDGIANKLFADQPASRECLSRKVFRRPSETEWNMILRVLRYHLGVRDCDSSWVAPRILEKEYLFAAVAVVNLIWKLKEFMKNPTTNVPKDFLARANELFGAECLEAAPVSKEKLKTHPLLRFFHCVELHSDDCWIQIPPGTLHAWQGGGNFLIEIGHRSDNTFRILDYGRELSDNSRDMHYEEAMYALNDQGFFNDQASAQLIVAAKPGKFPCHDLLDCQLYSAASDRTFPIQRQNRWSFLMNPDGDMNLIASDSNGFQCRISVRRCRTVLIESDVQVEVQPEQQDNRIMHFFTR